MREEKRELYREGTPENLKKGYTDLVYGGSGVEVEKGVISASGGSDDGGSGGGLFLYHSTNVDEFTKRLDKTWNEIKTALESGLLPINFWGNDDGSVQEWGWYFVVSIQHNENGYTVTDTSNTVYITDDPDGLPTYIQD